MGYPLQPGGTGAKEIFLNKLPSMECGRGWGGGMVRRTPQQGRREHESSQLSDLLQTWPALRSTEVPHGSLVMVHIYPASECFVTSRRSLLDSGMVYSTVPTGRGDTCCSPRSVTSARASFSPSTSDERANLMTSPARPTSARYGCLKSGRDGATHQCTYNIQAHFQEFDTFCPPPLDTSNPISCLAGNPCCGWRQILWAEEDSTLRRKEACSRARLKIDAFWGLN